MNLWIFDNMAFAVLHVSAPYKSRDFTFEIKIFIFVPLEMFLALHTFSRMLKMTLTLLILFFTSASVPPSIFTILPRYVNSSTSSKLVSFILIGCLRLALIFITLFLLSFGLSPSLIDVSALEGMFCLAFVVVYWR